MRKYKELKINTEVESTVADETASEEETVVE